MGNLDNESADNFDKEAVKDNMDLNYYLNRRTINKSLYYKYLELWKRQLNNHDKGGNVYSHIYQVNTGKIYSDFYLYQVVMEHGAFPDFQHKILEKSRGFCCGHPVNSV